MLGIVTESMRGGSTWSAGAVDKGGTFQQMAKELPSYFHLHLISDSTGETLTAIAKAASVQYSEVRAIDHVYPLVRSERQLERVLQEVEAAPGIVLYTIVNRKLGELLEARCRASHIPCLPALDSILKVFDSYLGAPKNLAVGAQHVLDADYFGRIEALNFTMAHDDGQLPQDLDQADIVILGISRTSKTPTSIYLANRGFKTANVPLVPEIPLPQRLLEPTSAFIVGLVASPERISQIRRNRVMSLADRDLQGYVDKDVIADEVAYTRRLCSKQGWPVIDVTRRSIEETAASILSLRHGSEGRCAEGEQATS